MRRTSACFILCSSVLAHAAPSCEESVEVLPSAVARVEVDLSTARRSLDAGFFGFNVEWLELQLGLWDVARGAVRAEAIQHLKPFAGAHYRYPGGHNANHFVWKEASGPVDQRPLRRHVDWLPPQRVDFGLKEYLEFVREVQGRAWYVANLQGTLDERVPADQMAKDAAALSRHLAELAQSGLPRVAMWELGNELDRSRYRWTPDEIATTAVVVAKGIRASQPTATFTILQQEYPAQADRGYSAETFNRLLRDGVGSLAADFAMHAYYDGPPHGPAAPYFHRQVCKLVDAAQLRRRGQSLWFTEHARIPPGAFTRKDWKDLWPGTSDLQAAISLADMTITLVGIPEVAGAFVHALHGSAGPWPLFHVRRNGAVHPSVTMWALRLLRESMGTEVLAARQWAPVDAAFGGQPAIRSVFMRDPARQRVTAWTVNRTAEPRMLRIHTRGGLGMAWVGSRSLADDNPRSSNALTGDRLGLRPDLIQTKRAAADVWDVTLPPYSVNSLQWQIAP